MGPGHAVGVRVGAQKSAQGADWAGEEGGQDQPRAAGPARRSWGPIKKKLLSKIFFPKFSFFYQFSEALSRLIPRFSPSPADFFCNFSTQIWVYRGISKVLKFEYGGLISFFLKFQIFRPKSRKVI